MTDSSAPLIELKALQKQFEHRKGELVVLEDIHLKVFAGDMVAIMGASGAGKSTLLQILGALDTPSSGQYLFEQQDVFARSASALAKFRNEKIGFVFQFHHLLPEFTAIENVMMPGMIARQKKPVIRKRAEQLLEMVGLGDRLNHQPGELSGGEQQRVAIARALFMEPPLLLADEPTGNLDVNTSREIHAVLKQLNEQLGVTIIIVTHDPNLAKQMPIQLFVEGGVVIPAQGPNELLDVRLPEQYASRTPERGPFRAAVAMTDADPAMLQDASV